MSRTLSRGTPAADCQEGFGYPEVQVMSPFLSTVLTAQLLLPPLAEAIFGFPLRSSVGVFAARVVWGKVKLESFHGISGMNPFAERWVTGSFVAETYFVKSAPSSFGPARTPKSVPPTAMFQGVEARPLTSSPYCANVSVFGSSQPAEPESPVETVTEMPCAAARFHNPSKSVFPEVPR